MTTERDTLQTNLTAAEAKLAVYAAGGKPDGEGTGSGAGNDGGNGGDANVQLGQLDSSFYKAQ